uniref:Uncharacterized protein n=1 Tax=Meloidogyne enterolobii TaxID=390850 RepID=A0A6V7UIN4_MELEN|nr:unnamed protein product [Meloidogyne enterolobii]
MFWCCCLGRVHRHQLHLFSYGIVALFLILSGVVFTIFAVFQKGISDWKGVAIRASAYCCWYCPMRKGKNFLVKIFRIYSGNDRLGSCDGT